MKLVVALLCLLSAPVFAAQPKTAAKAYGDLLFAQGAIELRELGAANSLNDALIAGKNLEQSIGPALKATKKQPSLNTVFKRCYALAKTGLMASSYDVHRYNSDLKECLNELDIEFKE